MSTNQCDSCVHKQICDLWSRQECQNAASYSSMDRDECDYYVEARRWIPVEERLPDLVPCGAGTGYSEAVNVLTSGRKVMAAVWDGVDWLCDMDYWEAWGEVITHWTPVLLPLPEPPKGE